MRRILTMIGLLTVLLLNTGWAKDKSSPPDEDSKVPKVKKTSITAATTPAQEQTASNSDMKVELSLSTPVAVTSAGEQINWQVIAGGGTLGTSTNYMLSGTVGQTAVGLAGSTNYSLNSGFWQVFGSAGCCLDPRRGDINYAGTYPVEIDISDLVYLVNFMFTSGPEPLCMDEANVNGLGVAPYDVDIADLVYMVNFMFTGGPEPIACP